MGGRQNWKGQLTLHRFIHIVSIQAVSISLAVALLACTCFQAECPTPPAEELRMGDLSALPAQPAAPTPSNLAPRQPALVSGLATSEESPSAAISTQEYLPGVEVRIYAGTGQAGGIDGPRDEATFDGPFGLAIGAAAAPDAGAQLYVSELGSGRIRVIDTSGFVWTWVGGSAGNAQWPDSPSSPFLHPRGMAVGARGELYVVDSRHGLTLIEDGRLIPLGSGISGFRDGPVAEAAFNAPGDVAIGQGGVVCLSDSSNNRVRMLSATGAVGTLAGSGNYGYRDGAAMDAQFTHPNGLSFDAQGLLYIADGGPLGASPRSASARIRVLSPTGQVGTYAGDGEAGYIDGPSAQARFGVPLMGLAFDGYDNLYVADMSNHVVRVVTREGRVLTVAGTGDYGLRGGTGAEAMLGLPAHIVWDGRDALYVADYGQNVIWQIMLPNNRANP